VSDEETWVAPMGRLYVRQHLSPEMHEMQLGYARAEGLPTSYRTIARIVNWRAEPQFGGWICTVPGPMGHSVAGSAIVRRIADDADIDAVVRLWSSTVTIDEWLRSVRREPMLVTNEKDRIERIAAQSFVGRVATETRT
jgi:hypothetical protein